MRVAHSVPGVDVVQSNYAHDFARIHLIDVVAAVRMHFQDSADALIAGSKLVGLRIAIGDRNLGALPENAGIDAKIRESTDILVAHDLKCERRKWSSVLDRTIQYLFGA